MRLKFAPASEPTTPDFAAEIAHVRMLLAGEAEARRAHDSAVAAVRTAQASVQAAEEAERDAMSADDIATAVAAASVARGALTSVARDLLTARDRLQAISAETAAAWRTLDARLRPILLQAEEKAETGFRAAAAALAQAHGELNELRGALGGRHLPRLHVPSPGDGLNAATLGAPAWVQFPRVEDITQLRFEFENRRSSF